MYSALTCTFLCSAVSWEPAMPGRVRRRRGPSASVPKEDGTAMVVKQRVVHTYSRLNPRQTVNKHHFLTPDTPGVVEEWELPSHLLRGSWDSTQLPGSISAQASRSNSIERTENKMDTSSSCDLSLVSMELTCETGVGPGGEGKKPLPSPGGTGVLTAHYCDTTYSSACLDSTSRKVRHFLDTITADLQHTMGDLPHTLTPLPASYAGGTSVELVVPTESPTITTEPGARHPSSSISGGTAQQEQDSEEDIEVLRTRDPCGEFGDAAIMQGYLIEKVSLEFSMSDHQPTTREDHTLLECIAESELEGKLCDGVGEAVLQETSSVDSKKTTCTEQRLPKSARGRRVGAMSGKSSTSCNSLEDHFSSLRMTPIVGLISPHLSTTPGSRAMAPLTSTPLAALEPGISSGTPRSQRGLVNLECTRDLSQLTPFFNQGHAYPVTSTPLHPPHHGTSRRGNVRRGGTPSSSSVGTTIERMMEFDEIGFDVSEVLDFGSPDRTRTHTQQKDFGTPAGKRTRTHVQQKDFGSLDRRSGAQRDDFGFSQIFSSSDTESQCGGSGKQCGARQQSGRSGSGNVERREETKTLTGSKRQGRNTKPGVTRRESRVQGKKNNFTSKSAAKSKSVVVPQERERRSVRTGTGKKGQSAKFTSKPAAKSKPAVVLKDTERKRQSVRMRAGKKGQSVDAQLKSLEKQSRNRLPPETSSFKSDTSCPLCVLTQVSMEAASQPHINIACTDDSTPEDILTQH